ncbi:putative polyvalent protein kinase domain-containing protein [Pedobacter sp.]
MKKVKEFLEQNGFSNSRNNDYINWEIGIILEDLHDENVLTNNGILFFIDTVFYLTEEFWKD